jgi:hypothetical protein
VHTAALLRGPTSRSARSAHGRGASAGHGPTARRDRRYRRGSGLGRSGSGGPRGAGRIGRWGGSCGVSCALAPPCHARRSTFRSSLADRGRPAWAGPTAPTRS